MQRAYRASIVLVSAALLLVGVAMVVATLASGGGGLTIGMLLGAMLAAIGAGRLWLALRGGQR